MWFSVRDIGWELSVGRELFGGRKLSPLFGNFLLTFDETSVDFGQCSLDTVQSLVISENAW